MWFWCIGYRRHGDDSLLRTRFFEIRFPWSVLNCDYAVVLLLLLIRQRRQDEKAATDGLEMCCLVYR